MMWKLSGFLTFAVLSILTFFWAGENIDIYPLLPLRGLLLLSLVMAFISGGFFCLAFDQWKEERIQKILENKAHF
jgi:hypothetical protein